MIDEDYLCQIFYKTETIAELHEQIKDFKIDIKGLQSQNADNTRQIDRLTNHLKKADEVKNEKADELERLTAQIEEIEVENFHKNK